MVVDRQRGSDCATPKRYSTASYYALGLWRWSGIGWDWHAIRNSAQVIARNVENIMPNIIPVIESVDIVYPPFFTVLQQVDMLASKAF